MFSLLAFIFSPCGHVGRGAWWLTHLNCILLTAVLMVVLIESLGPTASDLKTYASEQRMVRGTAPVTPEERAQEWAMVKPALEAHKGKLVIIGVGFLVLFWWAFVVEVKRWHDLGMSGFFVLFRFVPGVIGIFLPHYLGMLQFGVSIILLYFLGFKTGMYVDTTPGRMGKGEDYASGFGISLGILGAIVLSTSGMLMAMRAGLPWATDLFPISSLALFGQKGKVIVAAEVEAENAYHGTKDTQFAKDWVVIDGEKVTGVSSVLPAAGGKVCLVYAGGGKSARASTLPQGFLDDWKITPERLKAANGW